MNGRARILVVLGILAVAVVAAVLTGCSASETAPRDGLHAAVPNVVGMDQRTAREAVANSGYRVGQVSVESTPSGSPYTAPLVVISQQPLAGTSTARGAEVDLVLGLQRE